MGHPGHPGRPGRPVRRSQPPPHPRRRQILGLAGLLAGLATVLASFLAWLTLPDGAGGTTSITGWGQVSGGADMSGHNINEFLTGYSSYRPALLPVLAGGLAMIAGIVLAAVHRERRPHRVTAAVLALCALVLLGVAALRIAFPDAAGVLQAGEGHAGAGPWVTAIAGVMLAGIAVAVLTGAIDPAEPPRRPGIQPG